jgi:hypothetical protein
MLLGSNFLMKIDYHNVIPWVVLIGQLLSIAIVHFGFVSFLEITWNAMNKEICTKNVLNTLWISIYYSQ